MKPRTIASLALFAGTLAGCSSAGPENLPAVTQPAASEAAPTADAATRASPVVAGRPGRVFIFAGVGKKCEQLPAPEITITAPPSKGDVTFQPGQDTTIAASSLGTCIGTKAKGTGIYYTAKAGTSGTDTFSVTAKTSTGETMTRTFQVTIAQ